MEQMLSTDELFEISLFLPKNDVYDFLLVCKQFYKVRTFFFFF